MKRLFFLFFLLGLFSLQAKATDSLFQQANQSYTNEAYATAETLYLDILKQGYHSKEVYFNLGNTYYKLGQLASCIYYYEMALSLSPSDKQIQSNLTIAKSQLTDAVTPLPQTPLTKFISSMYRLMSPDKMATFSIICAFLMAIGFTCFLILQSSKLKKLFFSVTIISAILSGLSVYTAYLFYNQQDTEQHAIIFRSAWVKEEPIGESVNLFEIHEGTKVQIKEQIPGWTNILLENGQSGWTKASALKKLVL